MVPKEFELGLSKNFVLYDYVLPDGSIYTCGYPRNEVSYDEFLLVAETFARMSFLSNREYRLCAEAGLINKVGEELKDRFPEGLEIVWGGNKFFEYSLKDEERPEFLQWERYEDIYDAFQVFPNDYENGGLVEALMLGSFGTNEEKRMKIKGLFWQAMRDLKNNVYLIVEKDTGLILAAFVTKYLPVLEEVQLHSVAGKSDDPRILKILGKRLPIIMAAVLSTIDDHYPLGEYYGVAKQSYIAFQGVKDLTFSASGAAPLYEELGFQESNQAGIVLKPEPHT